MKQQMVPYATARGTSPGSANGAVDVWSQPQQPMGYAAPPAAPAATSSNPVQKVGRLLRGKMLLAIVLALICAVIGGVLGFASQKPTYSAQGVLQITPIISRVIDSDKVMPLYNNFMATEAMGLARDTELLKAASKDSAYLSACKTADVNPKSLGGGLKATFQKNTFNIVLSYEGESPEVAESAIASVVKAYDAGYSTRSDGTSIQAKMQTLDQRREKFSKLVTSNEALIRGIARKYGTTDLTALHDNAQQQKLKLAQELTVVNGNLAAARTAIDAMQKGNQQFSSTELAQVDASFNEMLSNRAKMQYQLDNDKKTYGPNSPFVVKQQRSLAIMDQQISDAADALRKNILGIIPDFTGDRTIVVTPSTLRTLEARAAFLQSAYDEASATLTKVGSDRFNIDDYQAQINNSKSELSTTTDKLEQLAVDGATRGELTIKSDGTNTAQMSTDKSKMMAVAGGLGGALLPVGLLMLLGLADTRYKYSDDATTNMSGVPLLGILPNLPDRLSDPAQASIAAHCVHQIRTMLQLNAMHGDSTAFSITSASSGDGKTSLSLALGLSFAASGSRTLLIDSDLIGGGLSSRLGINAPTGIVEALAGRPVTEVSQATDVADLSILPVGMAQAHHAGGFSPPAVRRMIADAKKHFEVIIIDTGPVMGSIEATPICASVDGVVLTVARGQSRPLVERAITHLNSVGAQLSGVVFNRAQHRDFEQSIGAISIRSAARSAANGYGHNTRDASGHIGPVARAVATSVRSGETNDANAGQN